MDKNTELRRALGNTQTLVLIDKRQGKMWASVMLSELETVLNFAEEKLAEKVEYEYSIRWTHLPSGVSGRISGWGDEGWGPKEEMELELADQKARDIENEVDHTFEYKVQRRRLRGEVEDV